MIEAPSPALAERAGVRAPAEPTLSERGALRVRAGTHALSLLANPLNVHVLTALEREPKSLVELRRAVGSPPQTTMRGHLRTLTSLGVLERRRQPEFPGSVDYQLGPAGRDMLAVVRILQGWLASAPDGPLQPGSPAAKSAIKALVEGWSSTIVRAIAARPLSLTDLNRLISSLNYPSLERRLGAMRLAGQLEPSPSAGRSRPYVATDWLRRAVAPLAAAAGWERRHAPAESSPIARLDIESAFLLILPMVQLDEDYSGTCRLAVETRSAEGDALIGVMARVETGRVVSCVARLSGSADSWVAGSTRAWMGAALRGESDLLEIGGDADLAHALIRGLARTLLGTPLTQPK